MSGKTQLMYNILQNARGMFETRPEKIIFCYGQYQSRFEEMEKNIPNLILYQGLPSNDQIEEWSNGLSHTILVLDDLMHQVTKNEESMTLFCVTAHHKQVSVFFLTQNLFMPGKYARTISLNCRYVILFRSVRDSKQIISFGSQVYPGKSKYFKDAYEKATSVPYGYLLIDMSPSTPDKYRLRTHILPGEETAVYLPQ
jgi:hypothetical protein